MGPVRSTRRISRGSQIIMTAMLLPVVFGTMALTVDTGVKAVALGQLRTVADAASLAGAMALASDNRLNQGLSSLSTEMSSARSYAIAAGTANRVLAKNAVIFDNPSNAANGQVRIGFLSPTDTTSPSVDSSVAQTQFNSVQVTAKLDATHGGLVPAYFSKIWGNSGSAASVTGIATIQNYDVVGFRPGSSSSGQGPNLLPITLDKTTYQAMMAGTTTDQYTYCPPGFGGAGSYGTVIAGADGITESQLYPVATGNPGNWGTVQIGVSNNSTSTLGAQIRYGITPAQLATFPNGQITLDQTDTSTNPPTPYTIFNGNPGISAGIKDDLASIIGRPSYIPIYDQTDGNGSNAWFRIITFATVRVLSVNFQGNPKYVIIQPCLNNDPMAIPSSTPSSAWSNGGVIRIFLAR
jgi:hypothetical protein